MTKQLLEQNPLFVFALEAESAELFNNLNVIYTGVGKVNASYVLTKKIGEERPSIIVNLGSAGSNKYAKETVVCCTQFVQRDMEARMLGCDKYETPFSSGNSILSNGLDISFLDNGICGTGDSFEVEHNTDDYNIIDMEAYALAYVAKQEVIPFLCLKYISDGADEGAAQEWEVMVHRAAIALHKTLDTIKG